MATKKSKVFKKASKNKRKIPRWGIVLVIGLVAAIGIFVIYRSFAATGLVPQVNTKKIIEAGGKQPLDDRGVAHRSPITLEACRMSDTPGDGPENRIYVGAKPIVTKALADKLNKVWDQYYPQYHIDGQDVPWAADYTRPYQVGLTAFYIVDNRNKTETTRKYTSLYKPSEAFSGLTRGGWWANEQTLNSGFMPYALARQGRLMEGGLQKGKYPFTMYKESSDPNVNMDWNQAIYRATPELTTAFYQDKPYNNEDLAKATGTILRSRFNDPKNTGTASGAADSPEKINQLTPPGTLPGRTTWSYLTGKVMTYNDQRCPGGDGIARPECYDIINNPNPMIYFDVRWQSSFGNVGQGIASGGSAGPQDNHYSVGVRFKDLPKCGQTPIPTNTQAQVDEYFKISQISKQLRDKAEAEMASKGLVRTASGIPIEKQWQMSDIEVNNGISPLPSYGFWTPRSDGTWRVLGGYNYW